MDQSNALRIFAIYSACNPTQFPLLRYYKLSFYLQWRIHYSFDHYIYIQPHIPPLIQLLEHFCLYLKPLGFLVSLYSLLFGAYTLPSSFFCIPFSYYSSLYHLLLYLHNNSFPLSLPLLFKHISLSLLIYPILIFYFLILFIFLFFLNFHLLLITIFSLNCICYLVSFIHPLPLPYYHLIYLIYFSYYFYFIILLLNFLTINYFHFQKWFNMMILLYPPQCLIIVNDYFFLLFFISLFPIVFVSFLIYLKYHLINHHYQILCLVFKKFSMIF